MEVELTMEVENGLHGMTNISSTDLGGFHPTWNVMDVMNVAYTYLWSLLTEFLLEGQGVLPPRQFLLDMQGLFRAICRSHEALRWRCLRNILDVMGMTTSAVSILHVLSGWASKGTRLPGLHLHRPLQPMSIYLICGPTQANTIGDTIASVVH